jgi:hypothetical protein
MALDAVFHADGTLADGPIALCEVQGYVYAAKRGAAETAAMLGEIARAQALMRQAEALREGLSVRGHPPHIRFAYPLLPPFLEEVHINNLRVGQASVDLVVRRHAQDVSVNIDRRQGKVEIFTVK